MEAKLLAEGAAYWSPVAAMAVVLPAIDAGGPLGVRPDGLLPSHNPKQTDATLRKALGLYDHVRLLHVAMGDAGALLRCFEEPSEHRAMKDLVALIFQHRWCYRPKEMAENWTNMNQWCVWGFAEPSVAPACG